jgi:indole-3-glycerol phosphate synthase
LEKVAEKCSPAANVWRALVQPGSVSLIAELKKASPSAGLLRPEYDVAAGARAYARAGARMLSVLTEEHYFQGQLTDATRAKEASALPVLRKDFIYDAYQVVEARAAEADAVLLIAALLTDAEAKHLLSVVREWGMTPLFEVHEETELQRAIDLGAPVIGVNSRNLRTLEMSPTLFEELLPRVPKDRVSVAESGIRTAADVKKLKDLGAHAMLVGESLLRQGDLEAGARTLVEAGTQ